MQLLDSEQIEIADEYFGFRAINPPCAGDCFCSLGKDGCLPCAKVCGTRLCSTHTPTQARTRTRLPRARRRVRVRRNAGLCPTPADVVRRFGRKSRGEAERLQGRERKGKGSRVQGSISLWTQRKTGWRLLLVKIFKANKAKVSAWKNN